MSSQSEYWLDLCDEDLITAQALLKSGRLLHMGFFCHMIVEKSLKAVVSNRTDMIPPKIHDLPRLASLGGLWETLSDDQRGLIKQLIPLQIESRYPEYKERIAGTLTIERCKQILAGTEDFLCWIKQQLKK